MLSNSPSNTPSAVSSASLSEHEHQRFAFISFTHQLNRWFVQTLEVCPLRQIINHIQ